MPLNQDEQGQLREALHGMNNALNSISMQAELAKLYTESHDIRRISEALEVIMSQCRQCSVLMRNTHSQLIGPAVGQSQ
jgi:signal transduction histidine kinase